MYFRSLLSHITPHRATLLLMLFLLLISSGLSLIQPWLAGQLTRNFFIESADTLLSVEIILLLWVGLLMLRTVASVTTNYVIGSTGEQIAANLRSRLHDHLHTLPLAYFQDHGRGDTLAILSNDAHAISDFVTRTLLQLLPLLLTFFGALIMMLFIDPFIAVVAATLLPAYYLATRLIGRKLRPLSKAGMEAWARLLTYLDESLGMIRPIKTFSREPIEVKHFEQHNQRILDLERKELLVQSVLSPTISFLAGLGLVLLLWLGIDRVASGQLGADQLVSLLLYGMLLNQPLTGLANVYGSIQTTLGAAERIIGFFNEQPEPDDSEKPELEPVIGDLVFDKVTFHYPSRSQLFKDFRFPILKAGEICAIIGPNGAGKSTLADLVLRLVTPDSGRILIDGKDISEVSATSIRRQIGYVAQHTQLMNGTVAENIAYGNPGADQSEIKQAARLAHAHTFIKQLPNDYNTVIGEQGIKLSGGQRQRLALARTLLLDPPVIILDEATAMFDPAGESAFFDECYTLLQKKTVLLITHRPMSLALADRVVSLSEGKVRTHDETKLALEPCQDQSKGNSTVKV